MMIVRPLLGGVNIRSIVRGETAWFVVVAASFRTAGPLRLVFCVFAAGLLAFGCSPVPGSPGAFPPSGCGPYAASGGRHPEFSLCRDTGASVGLVGRRAPHLDWSRDYRSVFYAYISGGRLPMDIMILGVDGGPPRIALRLAGLHLQK